MTLTKAGRVPKQDVRNLPKSNRKFSLGGLSEDRVSRMNFEIPAAAVRAAPPKSNGTLANAALAVGCLALVLPTMLQVARETWSTEQGGHGPLVLVTGMWALWRELKGRTIERRLGSLALALPLLSGFLVIFVFARITGVIEIEAFSMYGALITGAYLLLGDRIMRSLWFPLLYLAFALPPPDTVVVAITQPIKIAISDWVVSLLSVLGYPMANSGVIIQIGQYQLLVAAACAGLNSIVTLGALCLFYVYLRHRSNLRALLIIAIAAIPVAIISNFVRVLTLVLVTYYFGDATAQGFVHDFAGLLMFAVALLTIFAIDQLITPLFMGRKMQVTS